MRKDGRRSSNIEDRRSQGGGARRGAKLSGGGLVLMLIVGGVMIAMGKDPSEVISLLSQGAGSSSTGTTTSAPANPEEDATADFVAVVLADTEDTWASIFASQGQRYEEPGLVLFRDSVESRCGFQSAAVGPFYCPPDRKVYIDLSFFEQLDQRFGAPGDFAQAYVIGHEVGHHLQTLMGTSQRVRAAKRGLPEAQANALSVLQELQADCYAGIWAHHAQRRNILEPGDLEEGLRAASAIGDDTLQRRSGGRVTPESWTHGSSAQRVQWFRTGFESGDVQRCDTFEGRLR